MKYLGVPQSGSQANTTASRNKSGQYYRNRSTPVQPRTPKQTNVRAAFTNVSQAWNGLAGSAQASWIAYAAAHPVNDRLGQSIKLTGANWFAKVNVPNVLFGAGIDNVPPGPPPPVLPIVYSFEFVLGTSALMDFAPTPFPTDSRADLFAGGPQSPGVSYDNNLRYMGSVAVGDDTPMDFLAAYLAAWGPALEGQKVFTRVVTYRFKNKVSDERFITIVGT